MDREAILAKLIAGDDADKKSRLQSSKKELDKLISRENEIDNVFHQLYEDKVKGVINDNRFITLSNQYESELEALKIRKLGLQDLLAKEAISESDTARFVSLIEKYADMTELNSAIAHELIDCICIGKRETVGKDVHQEIRIVYKFVGEIA